MKSELDIPNNLKDELHKIGLNPVDLVLYINSLCNLRCKHCYVGDELLNASTSYSTNSIVQFLSSFRSLDRVTVLGGEPLLHTGFNAIIQSLSSLTVKEKRVTTNLTRLGDTDLDLIACTNLRMCVSLDGHNAELHDALRGQGMFSKTVQNLRKLIEHGIDVEVTHTVTALNIDSFGDLVRLCREIGVRRLNLHKVSLRGNAVANRNLEISATQWVQLTSKLESLQYSDFKPNLRVRYEVGFVTEAEYKDMLDEGIYKHHASQSYYTGNQGHRLVIFPNAKLYVSSEAFGTDAFIGSIEQGKFKYNNSHRNELELARDPQFSITNVDEHIKGDQNYPIVLSVSYRKTVEI